MAMYYNTPSAAVPIKLNQHDPWQRQLTNGPQPPSPAYPVYANGIHNHSHHPQQPQQHSHSHSLSIPTTFANQQEALVLRPASPNAAAAAAAAQQALGSPHWQQQMMKAEVSRQASSPHHRARASALASRNSTKAPIPITDPSRVGKPDIQETSVEQSHPSSMVAPVQARPIDVKENLSPWTTLDIGGMRIKHISPALFRFTYLTTLYLNHNHLSSVPPEIKELQNLTMLDLSGNQLESVPPELGLITSLRELYLFDNHLTTLPYELGTLHQLELLGIEGNPLRAELRNMIQQEGTGAVIAYLRDTCAVPLPPPERQWQSLQSENERKLQESDPSTETFSALCYNILCDVYATERMYGYTPSWALKWDYRKELILTEIMSYDADFLCLQEVNRTQYEDYFTEHLATQGYEGVQYAKSRARTMSDAQKRNVDGCATFWKASKYQLVEKHLIEFNQLALQRPDFLKSEDMFNRVMTKDNIALVLSFENRITGSRLVVANVHIHWDAQFKDVKLVQVGMLVAELEKIAHNFSRLPPKPPAPPSEDGSEPARPAAPHYSDGTKIPAILCGDFNSVPDSGVYEFLNTGSVAKDHPDFMSYHYGDFTNEGMKHTMSLSSSYSSIGELPLTNYTPTFKGPIDYIWYSTNTLNVVSLLGEVDKNYLSRVVGFPNAHFPSDHVCILSEFRVKPIREHPARSVHPGPRQS